MSERNLINVVFQQPSFSQEVGYIQVLTKQTGFQYETYEDAFEAFGEFSRNGFIEFDTPVGQIRFNTISVELLKVEESDEEGETEEEEVVEDAPVSKTKRKKKTEVEKK